MSETPRYDVKTKSHISSNPVDAFLDGTQYKTTIRDNSSGKEYKATGKTPESSRENAFKKAQGR